MKAKSLSKKNKTIFIKKAEKLIASLSDLEKFIKGNPGIKIKDLDTVFRRAPLFDDVFRRLVLKFTLCAKNQGLYDHCKNLLDNFSSQLSPKQKEKLWNTMASCVEIADEVGCNPLA